LVGREIERRRRRRRRRSTYIYTRARVPARGRRRPAASS
jgi:hypothetical protein